MSELRKILLLVVVGFMVAALFVPSIRQTLNRFFTTSEKVVVGEQEFKLVTLLGFDAIPAILSLTSLERERRRHGWNPTNMCLDCL